MDDASGTSDSDDLSHLQSTEEENGTVEKLSELSIADTTPDSTSDKSSSGSGEATTDGSEDECTCNPIYRERHTKERVDDEKILGTLDKFCAAFYHVHKKYYPDKKRFGNYFCLDKKKCNIASEAETPKGWKAQPKTVVAVARFQEKDGEEGSIFYQARYTNCWKQKKHAEDFFKEDVEKNDLAKKIQGGTITMYLTLQPCNWSTTPRTKGTKPNQSCCKTLKDIHIDMLREKKVKLCVKPTNLCRLDEVKEDDAGDDTDYVKHENVSDDKGNEHLRRNAVRGIKMLMRNGVDVCAMTPGDWMYLNSMTDKHDDSPHRKTRDKEIQKILNEIKSQLH